MWFAMHVKPGTEQQAVALMRSTSKSDQLEEVFCPMAECQVKDHGEQMESQRPMIEGTVFVVAPGKRQLRACTRLATGLEALCNEQPCFEALQDGEEDFVNLWAAPGERLVGISDGWIDKAGYLNLQDGPLFERQDDIQEFSGNRRWAFLETQIAGKPTRARAGVRITRNEHLHPSER